jgi:hypothetical protein
MVREGDCEEGCSGLQVKLTAICMQYHRNRCTPPKCWSATEAAGDGMREGSSNSFLVGVASQKVTMEGKQPCQVKNVQIRGTHTAPRGHVAV